MKKLIVVAVLSLAAVSTWAQSVVQFQNGGITFITTADRLVYSDRVGGTKLVGTNYAAQLWYEAGAGHADLANPHSGQLALGANGTGSGFFRVPTTSSPGLWLNPTAVSNTRTLDNVAAGTFATLQIRVFDTLKYNSFETAFAAGEYGWSDTFDWKAPNTGDPPNANYMDNLRAFALVPEPSTIALGVLGAASLLFLRRRK